MMAPPAAAAPAPTAAPQESGGGIGDTLMDLGSEAISSRAGSMAESALGAGKNLLGKIPGGAIKGGIAALGGAALSWGGDKLKESGHEKIGGAMDVAGQAASWGGTGAMIGSVIPGVGTAVGATVGALAGGAYGLYKNWGNLFGGNEEKVEGARATGGPVAQGKDYLVGERGPELFSPNQSGKITSNKDLQYGMKMSDVKGKATNSYKDEEGTTHEEYEGGVRVKRRKDGTVEVSGAGGTSVFDKSGKEIKQMSPHFGGYSEERNLQTGEKTENFSQGPLQASRTTNKEGATVSTKASYDMGMVKVETSQTAAQEKEGKVNYKALDAEGNVIDEGQATKAELEAALKKFQAESTAGGDAAGASSRDHAGKLDKLSSENADAKNKSAQAPVIINNNTTNAGGGKGEQPMMKGTSRNEESALGRYTNRTASYY
jgi:hypothetical protein